MKLVLELPDIVFPVAKTADDMVREARQALAMFWLARGDIPPERAAEVASPVAASGAHDFKSALAAMPDVGEDEDFERMAGLPRADVQWDV